MSFRDVPRHFASSRRWKKQNGPPRRSAVILLFPAPGKSKMSFRDVPRHPDASPSFCFFQALEKAKWASETLRRHFAFSSAWKKQNELPRRSASFRFFQALEKAKWASETFRRHFAFSSTWKKQNGLPRRFAVILLFPGAGKSQMGLRDVPPSFCFFQRLEKAKWASETFRRHFAFSSTWKKQNELPRRSASSETLRRHFAFSRRWKKQNGLPRRFAVILLFPGAGKSKMSFRDASPSFCSGSAVGNERETNKRYRRCDDNPVPQMQTHLATALADALMEESTQSCPKRRLGVQVGSVGGSFSGGQGRKGTVEN